LSDQITSEVPISIRFIRDQAADVDFFHTHSRVAEAIAEVIETNPNLKVIGLLGPWGSGKSTVIKLVETQLVASDQVNTTLFFNYDAWLYQNDPPRRSFLQAFLQFLIKNDLSTGTDWTEKLKRLNGQHEETETTTAPVLSASGAIVLLSLVLVPLAMQFLGYDALKDFMGKSDRLQGSLGIIGGFGLLLVPVFASIGVYIYRRNVRSPLKKSFWTKANFTKNRAGEDDSLWALFANKAIEKTKNRTTKQLEPSAIEFQELFLEILTEVARTGQRMVLVVDNLDRLHETDALAMWTTIRSFFLGGNQSEEHLHKLPIILLPMDDRAMARVYGDDSNSFMDKTFDLTFRIPAPVQSDWKAYMAERMKAVFGDKTPDAWIYQAARLFERSRQLGDNITPRSINTSINSIATLWLQRRHEKISFISIAYYSIFRLDKQTSLLNNTLRAPNYLLAEIDPDWPRSLAALHYGVSLESAFQVLIEDQLRTQVDASNRENFCQLAEVNGFGDAFLNLLDSTGPSPIVSLPVNATNLLASLEPSNQPWIKDAWPILRRHLLNAGNFDALDPTSSQAIRTLLTSDNGPSLNSFVTGMFHKLGSLSAGIANDRSQIPLFIGVLTDLTEARQRIGLAKHQVEIAGNASAFFGFCVEAMDRPAVLDAISTRLSPDALVSEIASTLESEWDKVGRYFNIAFERSEIENWDVLIAAADQLIKNHDGQWPTMGVAFYILGRLSAGHSRAEQTIEQLRDQGHLQQRLYELATGPEQTLAGVTALTIVFGPPHTMLGDWATVLQDNPDLPQLVDRTLKSFQAEVGVSKLIGIAHDLPETTPLVRSLVTRRILNNASGKLDVALVLQEFDLFLSCIEPSAHQIAIIQLSEQSDFWTQIEQVRSNLARIHILRTLLEGQASIPAERSEQIFRISKELLSTLTEDEWVNSILGHSEALDFALKVQAAAHDHVLLPGSPMDNALGKVLTDLLDTPEAIPINRWFAATRLLSKSGRIVKLKLLKDRLSGVSPAAVNKIIEVGGEQFLIDAQFSNDADAATRHVIVPQFGPEGDFQRLLPYAQTFGAWLSKSSQDTRDYVQERFNVAVENASADDLKTLQILASELKVKFPRT